jgi:hypothetical protein
MKKKQYIQLLIFLIFLISGNVNIYAVRSINQQFLDSLDSVIEKRDQIMKSKLERIDQLKIQLDKCSPDDDSCSFFVIKKIYEEYSSFQYDSAMTYVHKMIEFADNTNNKILLNSAKIDYCFTLVSAGLFKETFDSLKTIDITYLPKNTKIRYYYVSARANFDNADYISDSYYFNYYNQMGNRYLDTAIQLCSPDEYSYYSLSGLKYLRNGEIENARQIYETIMKIKPLNKHQYAIEASSLSYIYRLTRQWDLGELMLIKAAIADIEASIKETTATRQLASLFLSKNQPDRAMKYLKVAIEDAEFFNARHRKVQATDLLPQIEKMQYSIVSNQQKISHTYHLIIAIMGIIMAGLIVYLIEQNKRLRKYKTKQ